MSEQKITVPNIGDFKEVEVIEVLVKEGQTIKKDVSTLHVPGVELARWMKEGGEFCRFLGCFFR